MFSGLDVAQDQPRHWTAIVSFTLQAALLAFAVVYSVIYPQTLPFAPHRIFVPMAWSKTPTTTVVQSSGHAGAHALVTPIVVASNISFHPANEASGSDVIGTPPSIPMIGEGTGPGVPFVTPSENASPVLAHPAVHSPVIRTSSVMQGMLVRRVEPRYPPVAIAARIEGPVKIKAIISREGRIEQAEVLNGSPLLSGAALEAIRQWRYRPYILNGEPVEVETQITVNFVLGR